MWSSATRSRGRPPEMASPWGKTSALSVFHMAHGADRQGKGREGLFGLPPLQTEGAANTKQQQFLSRAQVLNLPRRPIVQFISLSTRSSFSRQPAWSAPHAASLALSSFAVRARSRPLASSTSPPAADAPTPADGPPSCAGAPPPPPEARRRVAAHKSLSRCAMSQATCKWSFGCWKAPTGA